MILWDLTGSVEQLALGRKPPAATPELSYFEAEAKRKVFDNELSSLV